MVNNSVLTNPESLVALRNLERTNRGLATIQNRISAGLKVTGAVDDVTNFGLRFAAGCPPETDGTVQ